MVPLTNGSIWKKLSSNGFAWFGIPKRYIKPKILVQFGCGQIESFQFGSGYLLVWFDSIQFDFLTELYMNNPNWEWKKWANSRAVADRRICIDYRKLNKTTRKDRFSLPFIDQMLYKRIVNELYCFLWWLPRL